jgi:SAM-dependent methyltransferase
MKQTEDGNGGQAAVWNGSGGHGWVEMQEVMDGLFQPLEEMLVDSVDTGAGTRVLDVGCGAGVTTLAFARHLGEGGSCTGIDISEPLVSAARSRAERAGVDAQFIRADAQRHPFEPATFDMVVSRFGVMFFDDSVQAFTNLRTATSEGGQLRLIVWRSPAENPFMTTAERAAAPLVTIPLREADAPGQFALADEQRVRTLLEKSDWSGIEIHPIDVVCTMPEDELVRYLTQLGPLGRALAGMDAAARDRVVEAVRPAFDRYVDGNEVRFTAACWMVAAQA